MSLRAVSAVAMSPAGSQVAFTVAQPRDESEERGAAYSELHVIPVGGGDARVVVRAPSSAAIPQWSPDGRTLTFAARLEMHDQRPRSTSSIQLYNLMKLEDIPVELVLYPREPHGLRERAHQLDYMRRILDWMGRYLR